MTRAKITISLTALAFLTLPVIAALPAHAQAPATKPIWSIWARNIHWQPCGDFNFSFSVYPHGYMEGDGAGIPDPRSPSNPYDAGQPITVIGWSITQRLSDNNAIGSWVVGSGRWSNHGTGADVFASGGGVGTNHNKGFFPPGIGLPQGGTAWINSRFDIYGNCNSGSQRFDVVIFYTSP